MIRKWLTRIIMLAGVSGLIVLVAWMFQTPPIPVDIIEAKREAMRVAVEEEGRARIRNLFLVSAPVGGKVLRSPYNAGDFVEKGKTSLAVIEPADPALLDARTREETVALVAAAEAAENLARAEIVRVRAELEFARKELARAEKLLQTNSVSERDYERARLNVSVQEAVLASADAALGLRQQERVSARARLFIGPEDQTPDSQQEEDCCIHIYSPVDGQILKLYAEHERTVTAGTPLVEVGNPADLEIVVELLSSDAANLQTGTSAEISWGEKRRTNARLMQIEPAAFTKVSALGIEEQRVNAILEIVDAASSYAGLGHEYRVYAYITLWEGEDILQVPLGALLRSAGEWAVFRVENGVARLTPVKINHRNGVAAEIIDGIEAGDKIIVHPNDRIADGVMVAPRE